MIYIKDDMRFLTIEELVRKIAHIKTEYEKLNKEDKELYKMYFFERLCLLPDTNNFPAQTTLWDYINGCDTSLVEVNKIYQQILEQRKKYEVVNK